jgi:hypothetical protein
VDVEAKVAGTGAKLAFAGSFGSAGSGAEAAASGVCPCAVWVLVSVEDLHPATDQSPTLANASRAKRGSFAAGKFGGAEVCCLMGPFSPLSRLAVRSCISGLIPYGLLLVEPNLRMVVAVSRPHDEKEQRTSQEVRVSSYEMRRCFELLRLWDGAEPGGNNWTNTGGLVRAALWFYRTIESALRLDRLA